MKKKWLLMVMALAMSASMAACNFSFGSESSSESTQSVADSSETPTDTTPEDTTSEDTTSTDSESGSSSGDSTSGDSSSEGDEPVGPVVETYLVKFVDSEGNVLSEAWLEEGAMPEAPTNVSVPDNTDYVTYMGAWDKEIVAVSGAATYTWVITESKIMVTVTFNGENATEVAKGETVTAPSIKQAGKIVTGWTLDGETVDLDTYVVTAPVNFEAVWAEVPYATSGENYMNACELPDAPGKWYYEIGSQETVLDWTVALPTMAYEEGKTITYNWVGGTWILVGINGNYVQGGGVGSEGTISITYADGMLKVTIENTANPATVAGFVSDEEVIAGNKALTLSINNGAQYHQFFLSKEYVVTDAPVVPTTLFDGTAVYDSEGAAYTPSNTSDTGAKYSVNQDYGMGTISLPKVDFTTYKQVTMDFATSGWIQFGWGEHLFFYNSGSAVQGTITLTYRDNLVYMVFESDGVTHPQGWELYFSSTDIHTGNEALTLGYSCLAGTQSITISNFTMTEEPAVENYTITFVDSDGNVLSEQTVEEGQMPEIPTNTTTPENTETMIYTGAWDKEVVAAAGDVTYTWVVTSTEVEAPVVNSVFAGAKTIFADGTTVDAALEENKATFSVANGTEASIAMPCIDYTKYNVTFNWAESNGYVLFGYNQDWYFNAGPAYYGTATLTYASGTLTLVMNSPVEGGGERTYSITAEDIINGTAPLTFTYMGWADGSIVFSGLVMTEVEAPVEPEEPTAPTYTFEGTGVIDGSGNLVKAAEITETGAVYDAPKDLDLYISLPKLDYTKVTKVTFDWQDSGWTKLGSGTAYYSENKADPSVSGSVEIVNNGDGTLTFTFTYGAKVKTETITDADIINGTKAMMMKIKVYGTKPLTISNYTVTYTEISDEPEVPVEVRPSFVGSQTIFTDGTTADATVGENNVQFNVANGVDASIALPCIDYTKYQVIMLDWAVSNGWIPFSCVSGSWYFNSGVVYYGTATLTYVNGELKVVMNSPVEGGGVREITITDAEILNGQKPLTFYYMGWADGSITLSNMQVYDYAINLAGAQWVDDDGTHDATVSGNNVTYAITNGKDGTVYLPCLDFTKYSVVTFEWIATGGWIPFSCVSGSWYFNSGVVYHGTATLTYANGELKVVMNSPVDGGGVREITITDAEIINGQKAVPFYYLAWGAGSISFSDMRATK